MKITPSVLKLDLPLVENRIEGFIKDYVEKCGTEGVVLGASGGLDSSTTLALASLSLGGDRVLGIAMPEQETHNATDIQHAKLLAEEFGFNIQVVDISSTLKTFFHTLPIYDATNKLSKGNVKARIRMVYLYYYANKLNRLVCGTSDKSETMMGYFTKWGDGAADISPIMDLYKTQVMQLASHVGVPTGIVTKPPSPRLWPNQLAEKELGIKYEILDLILFGLEHFMKPQEISGQLNLPMALVEAVKSRWLASEHKRQPPLTTKLGFRTVGKDFRVPRGLH